MESKLITNNPRHLWCGLQAISDYKGKTKQTPQTSPSLPDELNTFYARFEPSASSPNSTTLGEQTPLQRPSSAEQDCPITITEADVRCSFSRINPRKAAGPDGILGRVLKACAHQLAGVFTGIFNQSLSLRSVPTCFKSSTIIPIPKQQNVTSLNN